MRNSPTTSFLPDLAHERATSPLFQASAFAFRSFTLLTRIPSAFAPLGNKRHHHQINPQLEINLPKLEDQAQHEPTSVAGEAE